MAYPSLGFNTPSLQLGDSNSWMYQTNTIQPLPTAQPFPNQIQPWQNDLNSAIQNQTYSSLGLDSTGAYQPTGATAGGLSNWMSNNTDLLKTGVGYLPYDHRPLSVRFTGGLRRRGGDRRHLFWQHHPIHRGAAGCALHQDPLLPDGPQR